MKICDHYSHKDAAEIIHKIGVFQEIKDCIEQESLIFEKGKPLSIKKVISSNFNSRGWADNIKIRNTQLSINFSKSKVGVCFQIGNVARMYADILKLGYLFDEGIIKVGVICVPHQIESQKLGANYARYDRLKKEVYLFQKIINVPILIIGLSN
jgi:hypothetical protein